MVTTVLITTANNPPDGMPFLKMTDFCIRYVTAKASVFFWSAQGVDRIVIADATGGELLDTEDIRLLKMMNVEVEQISYQQNNELIKAKGKGYAEGQLIKFALENSNFLNDASYFYKCTGKIYCRNFQEIDMIIRKNNIKTIFWRHLGNGIPSYNWADTRFFFTTRDFCQESLIPAYLNADDNVAAAEHYVYKLLDNKLSKGNALRPLLSGFAGGSGKQYFDLSLGALDTSCPCWIEKI
jgi:hypothetical protein